MTNPIPVFKPSMGKEECMEVSKVIRSGWIGMGPKTEQFEKDFSFMIGTGVKSVATNSATAALHLALKVAGIKEGDEVITTPMTFASTAEAILYNNATPVFADIEYETLNIDPKDIEKKITSKTKAIIPVHFGGTPCKMDLIMDIAKRNNLLVIEDCAHVAGGYYSDSVYKGIRVGGIGNLSCFSFHAVKNLAMGDGGMITFDFKDEQKNEDILNQLKRLRWMGISKDTYQRSDGKYKWDYDIVSEGYKYHPNDIACAIGLVQLHKLDEMNSKRRDVCEIYNSEFKMEPLIDLPVDVPESCRHNYVCKLYELDREEFIQFMAKEKISIGVHYKPLYLHKRYSIFNKNDTPVTESVWKKLITLPLYPDLKPAHLKKIITKTKLYLSKFKAPDKKQTPPEDIACKVSEKVEEPSPVGGGDPL